LKRPPLLAYRCRAQQLGAALFGTSRVPLPTPLQFTKPSIFHFQPLLPNLQSPRIDKRSGVQVALKVIDLEDV